MKNKFITGALSAVVMTVLSSAVYAQGSEIINATYDFDDRTITVNAQLQTGKKNFLNIIILPNGEELNEATIKENEDVILKTVQTDVTGKITPQIVIPTDMTGRRYVCYVSTAESDFKYRFSTVSATELSEVTKKINKAGEAELEALIKSDIADCGLGTEDEAIADEIAKYISSQKPASGYSDEVLLNTYMVGEGVAYLESEKISLLEFVEEYSAYLDKDYLGEYNSLTETEKKELENIFKTHKINGSFAESFNENLFLAKYKTAQSSVELSELVTAYFNQNGISMSEFDKIKNKLYKDDIFAQLYKNKTSADSVAEIREAFDDLVEKALEKGTSGGGGSSSGGGGGSSSGSSRPTMTVEGNVPIAAQSMFNDTAYHWAKDKIEDACKKGIVNGFENGSFLPDKNVTRAEFAKMIAQALNLSAAEEVSGNFMDVAADAWYSECVNANVSAGIIFGDDNNNFNPQNDITRQDVAVMISRALTYKGIALDEASFGFGDEAEFSAYAVGAINALAKAGIVNGYDNGTFMPVKTASRAEAVVMIMRMEELISEKNN